MADGDRQKVLVVDDEEDIVWMVEAVLRKDYDVLTATHGDKALKAIETEDLACVIADHMMPGVTGVDVLDHALARRPAAARVLVTASERVNVLRDAINRARVHRFLSKPLRLAELPAMLADAIREARLEAENARLVAALERANMELRGANERLEAEVAQRTQELQSAVDELEQLALRDGLTGLFNHRCLQEQLDAEISRATRHGHPLSLLFIDVDHFKHYNDTHGHPAGDGLLQKLASVLTGGGHSGLPSQGRASDIVARYGGEEFVMVLPETPLEGALIKAERVRATIAGYGFEHADQQPGGQVSVSIGVATLPDHGKDKQELIQAADAQLYRAKAAGRNCICSPDQG
jgi:diguanylate cyclase (GGDEF)-like protein